MISKKTKRVLKMTNVAEILTVKPGHAFQLSGEAADQNFGIQKNHQNSLKGLIWGAFGSSLASASFALTATAVTAVVVGLFGVAFGPTHLTDRVLGERV